MTGMTVVTGGTGGVGAPLAAALAARGRRVRTVGRGAASGSPDGVLHLRADLADRSTHAAVVEGATALFVNPRAVGPAVSDLLQAAALAGVTRVVTLSALAVTDPDDRQPSRLRGDRNREVEDAVRACGLPWVSVRADLFMSNALGTLAPQLRAGDLLRVAHPSASFALVDERDVAAVAAVALTERRFDAGVLEVTGPEALTGADQLRTVAAVTGRELGLQQVPEAAARGRLTAAGFAPPFADAYLRMTAAASLAPARTTQTVAEFTGRPARTFAAWVSEHRGAFERPTPSRNGGHR